MDQSSAKPTIKLADFGDAVQLNTTYHIHPLLGNPEFAAPEIILGNPVSLTSDTWSVGVLAYVLLSGVSPFLDDSVEETCLNICRLDFSFPRSRARGPRTSCASYCTRTPPSAPRLRRPSRSGGCRRATATAKARASSTRPD